MTSVSPPKATPTRDPLDRKNSADSTGSDGTDVSNASTSNTSVSGVQSFDKLPLEAMKKHLINRIKFQELGKFYDVTKPETLKTLEETAQRLIDIPPKLNLEPELVMELANLALYDLCILIDNSGSMDFYDDGARVKSLRDALKTITALYGAIVPNGREIKIRYVNDFTGPQKKPPQYVLVPPPTTAEDDALDTMITPSITTAVDELVDQIQFLGISQIGTALQKNVLEQYVYMGTKKAEKGKIRNIGAMKRPLQVMVITDGEVEGEDKSVLPLNIWNAVRSATKSKRSECRKGVVFQLSRVGNDEAAVKYLKAMDDNDRIGEFVDTHPQHELGEVMMDIKKLVDVEKKRLAIKMLIGAIIGYYDDIDKEVEVVDPEFEDVEEDEQPEDDEEEFNGIF